MRGIFTFIERITGETFLLYNSINNTHNENDIPICNMHDQGYDDASNMSLDAVGVQAREVPLAMR